MDAKKRFIDFVERAEGLDARARMRLLLFVIGAKPATFVPFKITPRTLDEKNHFRLHLLERGVHYTTGEAKSFEQITAITKTKITWGLKGIWYGYDLFSRSSDQALFKKYALLHKNGRHKQAARIAAKIYNYPSCCVTQYIRELDPKYLNKNYTAYEFLMKRDRLQKAFPYLSFTPCSKTCARARKLNQTYMAALKKHAPQFYKAFSEKKSFSTDLIIDGETDVYHDGRIPVWLEKDGHEYEVVATRKFNGKYYLFTHHLRNTLEKGTIVSAQVSIRHELASITLKKIKGFRPGIVHTRHFAILPV